MSANPISVPFTPRGLTPILDTMIVKITKNANIHPEIMYNGLLLFMILSL